MNKYKFNLDKEKIFFNFLFNFYIKVEFNDTWYESKIKIKFIADFIITLFIPLKRLVKLFFKELWK